MRCSGSTGGGDVADVQVQAEFELVTLESSGCLSFQCSEFGVGVGRADVVDVPGASSVGVHDLDSRGPGCGGHGTDVRAHDSQI